MPTTQPEPTERVYSVYQLALAIKRNLLSNNIKLAGVWIEGEISGNHAYSSGTRYFTLKDDKGQISCVLLKCCLYYCDEAFRRYLQEGEARVNGLKVQIQGELDVNLKRGTYSMSVRRLRLSGLGDRMAQFEALKRQIELEGLNKLNHPELRRPLPFLPRRIGIITSPSGAVIHDMCEVLFRRFPSLQVRLCPSRVQGDAAAKSLVGALHYFNELCTLSNSPWRPDLVIIGRGGGSMEDLWVFNHELVVRGVAQSVAPIISAVGHESDVTLCDYVADLRAGTPSIAAECAVRVKSELLGGVATLNDRAQRALTQEFESRQQSVTYWTHRLAAAPQKAFSHTVQRLERLQHRLALVPQNALSVRREKIQRLSLQLEPLIRQSFEKFSRRVENETTRLALLNPFSVLERGYSITTDSKGVVVKDVSSLQVGDTLTTRVHAGCVTSAVKEVQPSV